MGKTCLSCKKFISCDSDKKSGVYKCKLYKGRNSADAIESTLSYVTTIDEGFDPDTEYSIARTIRKVISDNAKSVVAPDLRIDDRHIPRPANFFSWATGKEFLNESPYAWQSLCGIQLFAEWCPRCSNAEYFETFDKKDGYDVINENIALLEFGVCPHCGAKKSDLVQAKELKFYREFIGIGGQRIGKSWVTAGLASYATQWLLTSHNPVQMYGLASNSMLHGTFAALTYGQAKDTLWEPYYGFLLESPWFQNYHSFLDSETARTGEDLYNLKDSFVVYRFRRLQFYPAGPDRRILRGKTRYWSSIDEFCYFPNTADAAKNVKMNANEVYTALDRSLGTVRPAALRLLRAGYDHIPTGYMANVSSPDHARDKGMELLSKSKVSNYILGMQRPTWELNPNIEKEDLSDDFLKDESNAWRDWGARPALSSNSYMSNYKVILSCMQEKARNRIDIQFKDRTKDGETTRSAKIIKNRPSSKKCVLAVDAGITGNSFSMTIGHLKAHRWPVIDAIIEIVPQPGIKLNFTRIYKDVICTIFESWDIGLFCADRWQSFKMMSDAEEEYDVKTRIHSVNYDSMLLFREHIQDKQILLPKVPIKDFEKEVLEYDLEKYPLCFVDRPIHHLFLQMLTVRDIGNSVIKGENLTDDSLRSTMLCFAMLMDEANAEYLSVGEEEEEVSSAKPVDVKSSFVMRSRSASTGRASLPTTNGSSFIASVRGRK